jgi:type III restriction enzyme
MSKMLQFKFESNQQHQKEAIDSVIGLFKGFSQDIFGIELGYEVIPNIKDFYDFDEEWLYGNYLQIVNYNNELKKCVDVQPDLPLNPSLIYEEGLMFSGVSDRIVRFPIFTIEMETGTGKTYAYLRTIHELRMRYGFRKFIVVVPSIAIYEGTIKAFKQTYEHFKTLYGNNPTHLTEYDGQKINRVREFANSSFTEIMVMTIDSFNKQNNLIYKPTEKLQGEKLPIEYIQSTRPILILDESQNYRSNLSREALRTLNPLFAINYSATPIDKYNLIYKLSPVDAFRHDLVKKIKVLGVTQQHNLNDNKLSLSIENITIDRGLPTATVKVYVIENGIKKQKLIKLKKNDDLFIKTNNEEFLGFEIDEINAATNTIKFTNQSILNLDNTGGITLSKKDIFRIQIQETIRFHFERQRALREKGIKVLSLFFIDRVANYKGDDPFIKNIFETAFNRMKKSDEYFKNFEATDVHKGYFAQKKDDTNFLDSFETKGKNQNEKKKIQEAEKEAFHLIMQDKEKLLSFQEKTAFIFAHSALREGWDNPNVFCICTLNTTKSENRKRQEIGRGLRLARNEKGEQVKDRDINILTVVANESYENYVRLLQSEYAESGDITPPVPTNAKRYKAKRNDIIYNNIDFRIFWKNLAKKTDYIINIDTEQLIGQCVRKLNSLLDDANLLQPQIVITMGEFNICQYSFYLLEARVGYAKIKLNITDIKGKNEIYEYWYPIGYDFGRKSRDVNLKGFKIIQIDENTIDPIVYFGNGVKLQKTVPYSFSGKPDVLQHERIVEQTNETYPVFNLINRTSKALGLTRPTIFSIFKKLNQNKKEKLFINPEGFSSIFIKEIEEQLTNHIAERIEYNLTKHNDQYDLNIFFPSEKDYPQRELIVGSEHSLYDHIQTDSDIERNFIQSRVQEDDIKGNIICYFKFPINFKIHIPKIIGNYNPDWGIIRLANDGTTKLHLVRETKGTMNPNLLQYPNEKRKIDCAKKHFFAIGINYRQINDKIITYWENDTQQSL